MSNRNTQNNAITQQNVLASSAPELSSSAVAPSEQPQTRARGRRGLSKFKGFADDDDNFSSLPKNSLISPQSLEAPPSSAVQQDSESQGLFVSQHTQADAPPSRMKSPTPPPRQQAVQPSRKRTAPTDDPFIDSLAPTTAALKRRRLEEASARRQRGSVTPPPATAPLKPEPKQETQSPQPKSKAKKNGLTKEDDEALEQARLKAEEASRLKREALEIALDGIPISAMGDLAIIETMPVGRSLTGPSRTRRADESARWDEKWNGRKNFKKFKRKGGEDGTAVRRKVIVRLEEAKKRDFGIGEEYWLESSGREKESQKRKKKSAQTLEEEVEPVAAEDEAQYSDVDRELAAAAAEISKPKPSSHRNETIDVPSSSDVEVTNTRSTRSHPSGSSSTQTQTQTQTQKTLADKMKNSIVPAKRPAPTSKAKPAPKKGGGLFGRIHRQDEEEDDDSDDDDDGMAFKFKRKK